jgi:hypothetical protein
MVIPSLAVKQGARRRRASIVVIVDPVVQHLEVVMAASLRHSRPRGHARGETPLISVGRARFLPAILDREDARLQAFCLG